MIRIRWRLATSLWVRCVGIGLRRKREPALDRSRICGIRISFRRLIRLWGFSVRVHLIRRQVGGIGVRWRWHTWVHLLWSFCVGVVILTHLLARQTLDIITLLGGVRPLARVVLRKLFSGVVTGGLIVGVVLRNLAPRGRRQLRGSFCRVSLGVDFNGWQLSSAVGCTLARLLWGYLSKVRGDLVEGRRTLRQRRAARDSSADGDLKTVTLGFTLLSHCVDYHCKCIFFL